jgi:hypothetical protein
LRQLFARAGTYPGAIPAKAQIPIFLKDAQTKIDSRLRGNDNLEQRSPEKMFPVKHFYEW